MKTELIQFVPVWEWQALIARHDQNTRSDIPTQRICGEVVNLESMVSIHCTTLLGHVTIMRTSYFDTDFALNENDKTSLINSLLWSPRTYYVFSLVRFNLIYFFKKKDFILCWVFELPRHHQMNNVVTQCHSLARVVKRRHWYTSSYYTTARRFAPNSRDPPPPPIQWLSWPLVSQQKKLYIN